MCNSNINFALLIIIAVMIMIGCIHLIQKPFLKETKYSGVITSKLYEPPTSGYKRSSNNAEYWVFLKENKKGLVIRVRVSVPTYHDLDIGDSCTFNIKNESMYDYGNTTNPRKNLYNE